LPVFVLDIVWAGAYKTATHLGLYMDLFDIAVTVDAGTNKPPFVSSTQLAALPKTEPSIEVFSGQQAAASAETVRLISQVFNESFGYRPDGKPYKLGPKSVTERLLQTDYVFLAGGRDAGVGYLFGKEIPSSMGRIAWIESMAVLPIYRRHGIGTSLVRSFTYATKASPRLGCATPNPIAALIVSRAVEGKMFVGKCYPPYRLIQLLKDIRQYCFDLRGCAIDETSLTIRTGFSPLSRSDQREWRPTKPEPEPTWWSSIEHLPNEYEALLIVERHST
jgi:GNAT superfamily N-acetyltransferase